MVKDGNFPSSTVDLVRLLEAFQHEDVTERRRRPGQSAMLAKASRRTISGKRGNSKFDATRGDKRCSDDFVGVVGDHSECETQ